VILANEFGYTDKNNFEIIINQIQEIQKMITGLYKSFN
jgi:hypothetical protein